MDAEQLELFRKAVLLVFDANDTRFGLGPMAVQLQVAALGFPDATTEQVTEAIEYLEGKQMLQQVRKEISRENRAWRISSTGVAFLDR